jgi:hypothetical protein
MLAAEVLGELTRCLPFAAQINDQRHDDEYGHGEGATHGAASRQGS